MTTKARRQGSGACAFERNVAAPGDRAELESIAELAQTITDGAKGLQFEKMLAEKIDVTRWMVDYFESNFGSGPHR